MRGIAIIAHVGAAKAAGHARREDAEDALGGRRVGDPDGCASRCRCGSCHRRGRRTIDGLGPTATPSQGRSGPLARRMLSGTGSEIPKSVLFRKFGKGPDSASMARRSVFSSEGSRTR